MYLCNSLVGVTFIYKCKIGLTQDSANFLHEICTYASHKRRKKQEKSISLKIEQNEGKK